MVNVAGVPAIVFPVPGEHPPRGVQLIGRMGTERRLLQLAGQATR